MKSSIRQSRGTLLPLAFLMLALGCSTNVGVQTRRDGAANFSQYRSWSWLSVEREDESPRSDIELELAALVLEHIHREFSERGFIYRSDNADLGVDARLAVTRERHVTHHNTAIESLHSFHSSPSYEVQATTREVVNYQRGRLTIRVMDLRRNREVWRGEYEKRHRDHLRPGLARSVRVFADLDLARPDPERPEDLRRAFARAACRAIRERRSRLQGGKEGKGESGS